MTVNKAQSSLFKKFADKFNFLDEQKLISTLKATAFKVKDSEVTDEQMMALLIVADQYGLNPFIKEIFAYPDKNNGIVPVVSVDGWSRIINQHPDMDGLEFVYDNNWVNDLPDAKSCPASIECVIYRKGRTHPVRIKEFLDETYRQPFHGTKNSQPYTINGPWQSHTKRMLRHKSLIQCSRIAFGFTGIYDQDEADRIIEGQAVVVDDPSVVNEASDEAKKMLPRLVNRAKKEGSWQAALDYAGNVFSGFDATFLKDELNKAKAAAEAALLHTPNPGNAQQPAAQQPLSTNDSSKKPVSASGNQAKTSGNANGNSAGTPSATGSAAPGTKPHQSHLSQARESLS